MVGSLKEFICIIICWRKYVGFWNQRVAQSNSVIILGTLFTYSHTKPCCWWRTTRGIFSPLIHFIYKLKITLSLNTQKREPRLLFRFRSPKCRPRLSLSLLPFLSVTSITVSHVPLTSVSPPNQTTPSIPMPLPLPLHSLVNLGPFLLPLLSNSDLFLSFQPPIPLLLEPLPFPNPPANLPTLVRWLRLFNLDRCLAYGTSSISTSIFTINRYFR